MKKSVIALILIAVLVIIVSPGIVGKLAEKSVSDNLNWAADQSGELVITSTGFDRGWFSSEGLHRVEIGDGELRATLAAEPNPIGDDEIPALLISTHIDHGIIPVSSLGRDKGSLAPGLGRATSTLAIEFPDGEKIDWPGVVYTELGLGGQLISRYELEAGSRVLEDAEIFWEPGSLEVRANAKTGDIEYVGKFGKLTAIDDVQPGSIDGLSFSGTLASTQYGLYVGNIDFDMGAARISDNGVEVAVLQRAVLKGVSSIDDGRFSGATRFELSGVAVPGVGDISMIADVAVDKLDAAATAALSRRMDDFAAAQSQEPLLVGAEQEIKDLLAGGFDIDIRQLDIGLPMGTVTSRMSFELPESDRASFEWSSLLLALAADVHISVPELLVELATSMDPQAGALVGMGYLAKDGDFYILDAKVKKGLLTINGAPVPLPIGAF